MAEKKYIEVYAEDCGDGCSMITIGVATLFVKNEELLSEESLIEKAKEDGRNEAWGLARKINKDVDYGGLNGSELRSIFGTSNLCAIYVDNTYSEALAKYNAWEESNEIHIWDEVVNIKTEELGIVIDKSKSTGKYYINFKNRLGWFEAVDIQKTGRKMRIG